MHSQLKPSAFGYNSDEKDSDKVLTAGTGHEKEGCGRKTGHRHGEAKVYHITKEGH